MKNASVFLTQKLRRRAETRPDDVMLGFLENGSDISQSYTAGELDERVNDVANALLESVAPHERVLLLFPPGLDFVVAFLACLRADRIAVPAIPPEPHKPARSLARLTHLVDDARPALVLSTTLVMSFRPMLDASVPNLAHLPWLDVSLVPHFDRRIEDPIADGVAFLQYTSGSTADPKGVRVLRRNLTHNLHVIHGVAPAKPRASVSWLPQFHDMGLIEGILLPLDGGWPAWLMPPWAFLQQPLAWLRAIERFEAMRSGGPNFAYDLCTRKIEPELRAKLDLSCWQQAYCGAEPIRAATLAAFANAFAAAKFSASCFFPCYGLAEHTVLATCRTHEPYFVERLATTELARGRAVPANESERAVDVVCVGEIPPEVTVCVVDSQDKPLCDGMVGEIYLQSGSVADGYWRDENATAATFRANLQSSETSTTPKGYFLRTGDLGYRRGNQLFIVGRRKDVLIVHGKNHHAHDVERTAESAHAAIRRGCVCAVMNDALADGENDGHPVVICEVDGLIDEEKRLAITTAVHRLVAYEHGIAVDIALVPKHTIPKTSSGKLQRRATAQMLRDGRIEIAHAAIDSMLPDLGACDRVQKLQAIVCRVAGLSPNEIDVTMPPAQLPLDSLQTVDVLAAAECSFGRTLSLSEWSEASSFRDLLERTERIELPWKTDIDRPLPITFTRRNRRDGAILVTGGTGLIGTSLVRELTRAGRRVYVLARGAHGVSGFAGDVAKPRFGLDEPLYCRLVAEVDVVVHVAGAINWVLPYSSLAPTNVDGTVHVLEFCADSGARLVHVSSQIVCHGTLGRPDTVVDDLEDPETLVRRIPSLPFGYAQSKAVSEWLVHRAAKAGFETTIVRPGLIPASLENTSPDDIISILVRAFIESGAAPDVDWPFSVCPEDHLVRVMASLVEQGPRLVHLTDESRSSREIVAWLVLAGYDVQLVPWESWLQKIENQGLHRIAPLRSFWPFLRAGTLLSYARPRRARMHVADVFRVEQPLDPAFIDERLRAWQTFGWLPQPKRHGARATASSRAFPNTPRQVVVQGQKHDVVHASVAPLLSGGGILSRLAAGFCNRPVGIYPAHLTLDDGRQLDVVLKASARGDELRALCATVARASNPTLANALDKLGEWLDVGAADARERALYRFTNGSLARFLPQCHSTFESFDQDTPLVLERLRVGRQVEKLDAVSSPWPLDEVSRVVHALAYMHAAYRERFDKLAEIPWARPVQTTAGTLLPLWEALFAHARTQIDPEIAALAAPLLENLQWSDVLRAIPSTLLHNDANPRNLALRAGGTADIVLYDWELSAVGPSMRDLAEWLCFTLSPSTNHYDALALVRAHASIAVPNLDDETVGSAFHAALAWFFFDRLTTYTVVSPIYDLPWLARVFATWRHLVQNFDPARSV